MSYAAKGLVFGALLTLMGGCGGGGGSAGSVQLPTTPIGVNANNAELAAADSYGAVDMAVGAGDMSSAFVTAVSVDASPGHFRLASFARRQLERLADLEGQLINPGAIGAVVSITIPCDTGSVTVSLNDADNNQQFSSGDTFSMTFNSCFSAADNVTITGGAQVSNFTLTGNPTIPATPWNMSATFSFTNLGGKDLSGTSTINGGFSFALGTADGITHSGSVSGTSLFLSDGTDNGRLSDFVLNYTTDTNTLAYTMSGHGTISSSMLGGSVSLNIETPFQGMNIDLNPPDSGVMRITGANNSSVVLNAMGGDSVRLDVDADGDGVAETNIATTWTAIKQA